MSYIYFLDLHEESFPLTDFSLFSNNNTLYQFIGASMGTSNLKIPTKSATSEDHNSLPSKACCVVVEYLTGGTLKKFLIRNVRKKLALKAVIQIALDLSRG